MSCLCKALGRLEMPKILKTLLRIMGGIAAIYLVCVGILVWQLRTITDVSQYGSLLTRWEQVSVNHFPASVPDQATNVRVSYFPGFLQGGAHLQLRAEFPLNQLEAEHSRLSHSAIAKFVAGEVFPLVPNVNYIKGMPPPAFYAADKDTSLIYPDDYIVFILSAEHGDSVPWNHGRTKGIAISPTRMELVYWVERW